MEAAITFFKAHFGRSGAIALNVHAVPLMPDTHDPVTTLTTRQVVGALTLLASVLLAANLVVAVADYMTAYNLKAISRLVKIFSVDRELNAPAFFSTGILVFSAALLAIIAFFKQRQLAPYRWHWAILAMGFLFMAFDEMASVHERLIEPMRAVLGKEQLGVLYFAWVVPAIGLVLLLGAAFARFWWNLPRRTRLLVGVAAALYLGGAIGIELLDGNYAEIHGKKNLTYMIFSTVEETLEMAGIIVFIKALLDYIAENYRSITCHFAR